MADLLNHPLIAERYFYPTRVTPSSRLDIEVEGAVLSCGWHPVGDDSPTLVFFHGNGETVASWQGIINRPINALGWNLLLAEYRGYGASTGRPHLGELYDDVPAIIRAAGDPERTVVMGRSVGSLFAADAVKEFPNLAGLIMESGIADSMERVEMRVTRDELGGTDDEFRAMQARLDQRPKLAGYTGPTLVMHAKHDNLVPVSHGERLAAWAGGPTTLRIFDEGDHNTIMWENLEEYFDALAEFLAPLR